MSETTCLCADEEAVKAEISDNPDPFKSFKLADTSLLTHVVAPIRFALI